MESTPSYRVAAVVVTYGSRRTLLAQTLEAILHDEHIVRVVVVDNASDDKEGLLQDIARYGDRVTFIRHDINKGSAGGFAAGIEAARKEAIEYIYLSDDDVVISPHFVEAFKSAHAVVGDTNTVLLARRASFWAGTDVHYAPVTHVLPRRYFNIVRPGIFLVFLKALLGIRSKHVEQKPYRFFPIIPAHGWAYAGALLPLEATLKAPLPDRSLGLYLDDIAYSWGVIDSGYPSFALMEPHLTDLEMTHSGSHTVTGLFSPSLSSTKIYYETRNRVRVSLMWGKARRSLLFLQVCIWYIGVCLLGLTQAGLTKSTLRRMGLIAEALKAGFDPTRPLPQGLAIAV